MDEIIRQLQANFDKVRLAIKTSCQKSGRREEDIKVVVVTKYVDSNVINLLSQVGITDIGENRVQEAERKIGSITNKYVWHMVGTLQTNKVKKALEIFEVIHSLDRLSLARELHKRLSGCSRTRLPVFLQVNVSREESKHGIRPEEVEDFLKEVRGAYQSLDVVGLMTMAPIVDDPQKARPYFRRLRELSEKVGLAHLSMGMSQDFTVAVEEGADYLRIGSIIFDGIK